VRARASAAAHENYSHIIVGGGTGMDVYRFTIDSGPPASPNAERQLTLSLSLPACTCVQPDAFWRIG